MTSTSIPVVRKRPRWRTRGEHVLADRLEFECLDAQVSGASARNCVPPALDPFEPLPRPGASGKPSEVDELDVGREQVGAHVEIARRPGVVQAPQLLDAGLAGAEEHVEPARPRRVPEAPDVEVVEGRLGRRSPYRSPSGGRR